MLTVWDFDMKNIRHMHIIMPNIIAISIILPVAKIIKTIPLSKYDLSSYGAYDKARSEFCQEKDGGEGVI